jgi:hypothetical protein
LGEGAGLTAALAAKAALASPTFTGVPAAPTAAAGTSTTQLATTAFVTCGITTAVTGLATLASPTFTGTPAAPTAAGGTNTTQIATTAFVHTAVTGLATLASPTFTGVPAAPTAAGGTNTTQLATTAFVTAALAAFTPPALTNASGSLVASFNITTTGQVTYMTTAALAVGTWLIHHGATISLNGNNTDITVVAGTATATFSGETAAGEVGLASIHTQLSLDFIAVVTVAGTLVFQEIANGSGGIIESNTAVGAFPNATGYTAVKLG